MKYCKYCGSEVEDNSKFCQNCGASVEERNEHYNDYDNTNNVAKRYDVKERNIVLAVILTIVTCGIYGIYWMVKINDELLELSQQEGPSGIVVVLLTFITCGIYGIYWCYKMGGCVDIIKKRNENMSLIFLLLCFLNLSIVNYIIAQYSINSYARERN